MGIIIIAAILSSYAVAARYVEPEITTMIVLGLACALMIIAYVIVQAFEQVVRARRKEQQHTAELLALKDQFVFVAAHELRAPATAIKWALQVVELKSPKAFEKSPESRHALETNSDRLLRLVEDLLQVSRLESGVLSVVAEPIAFGPIVKESFESFAGMAKERGVSFENTVPTDLPDVVGDPVRLREVVDNLVSNGIKYNKVGGKVAIGARSDGEWVILSVTDTGAGLSIDERVHVFEKFWRANRNKKIEGTGLGLFIVRQLVVLMQGMISFKTAPGKGTTFFVQLKRAPVSG